nr:protein DGCR6L isoform X1 [Symphalangus syndactylus]
MERYAGALEEVADGARQQERHYQLLSALQSLVKELPSSFQQRLSYTTLSDLALALLDGTVFEIVQGLLEIQHLTEKSLYNQRLRLQNEHRAVQGPLPQKAGSVHLLQDWCVSIRNGCWILTDPFLAALEMITCLARTMELYLVAKGEPLRAAQAYGAPSSSQTWASQVCPPFSLWRCAGAGSCKWGRGLLTLKGGTEGGGANHTPGRQRPHAEAQQPYSSCFFPMPLPEVVSDT